MTGEPEIAACEECGLGPCQCLEPPRRWRRWRQGYAVGYNGTEKDPVLMARWVGSHVEWTYEHELGRMAGRARRRQTRREERWVHVQNRRRELGMPTREEAGLEPADCEMCGEEPCLCHLLPDCYCEGTG